MTGTDIYLVLFAVLVLEGIGIPAIPFEPVFVAAGYLIERGELNFWWAVMVGTVGNLLGNVIGYWIGYTPGRGFIKKLLQKGWGPDSIDKAGFYLEKYGAAVIVFARWFGPIRTPVILMAGAIGMKLKKYIIFSALGAFSWTGIWQYASWKGTKYILLWWPAFFRNTSWVEEVLLFITVIFAAVGLVLLYRRWRNSRPVD